MPHRRTQAEIDAAVERVSAEPLLELGEIARAARVSRESVLAWILQGRKQVYLDAVHLDGRWLSSLAALARFRAQRQAKTRAG